MSDAERDRRVALNETFFREVNDQVESIVGEHRPAEAELSVVCECGDDTCADRITIARDAYQRVRAEDRLFVVVPGHAARETERVVDAGDGYDVVEKATTRGATIAERP